MQFSTVGPFSFMDIFPGCFQPQPYNFRCAEITAWKHPQQKLPLEKNPPKVTPVGLLGSGPVSWFDSVTVSFQFFALRMLLHSAGLPPRGFFSRGNQRGMSRMSRGGYLIIMIMFIPVGKAGRVSVYPQSIVTLIFCAI